MLLDEDPATLIHHTIGNFNIAPDKLAVARINDCLSGLKQSREIQVSHGKDDLKRLTRTLTTLQNQHHETLSTYSQSAHVNTISKLDSQKFRVAKQAQDIELANERLHAQLADLEGKLQELEIQGVEGGEGSKRMLVEDEVLLKLKVYRSLGFEREAGAEGKEERVVLRKGKEGVHVVNMDAKFSRYFYANYFWGLM